jgi:HNH endonuclease
MAALDQSERSIRRELFKSIVDSFGKVLPAEFLRRRRLISGLQTQLHPLIEGIFKPRWSSYALAIASMRVSRYIDSVHHNPDGSWWIMYSAKAGGADLAVNQSLFKCIVDQEPVLAVQQVSDKSSPSGSMYRLLGLGFIESFDRSTDAFRIRGLHFEEMSSHLRIALADELIDTALRLETLEEWTPFVQESRAVYRVSSQKREAAFRQIVLENYLSTCAVTGQRFVYGSHIEAEAAHIISKEVRGTDNPRNGLALSRSAHWAFEKGVFTISDQYEIIVHSRASEADVNLFPVIERDRKQIFLPSDELYFPHPEALEWHRQECFGHFCRA